MPSPGAQDFVLSIGSPHPRSTMEDFIATKLRPTPTCSICTEPFSSKHAPVALPCTHIFGHSCIKTWLLEGHGNTQSCPFCRHEIIPASSDLTPTDEDLWNTLCAQPHAELHDFMTLLWRRVQRLCANHPSSTPTAKDLIERAVTAALYRMARDSSDTRPFHATFHRVKTRWRTLRLQGEAQGIAIPLVRLVRLMTLSAAALPKWMTGVARTSVLFWEANAALGTTSTEISWEQVDEAARVKNQRYFAFLHLFTVLLSQNIVHSEPRDAHARSAADVVERCCRRIGGEWAGRPSEGFLESVREVYEALRRYQVEEKRISLRGLEEERAIVMGLWGMVGWKREEGVNVQASSRKEAGGWGD